MCTTLKTKVVYNEIKSKDKVYPNFFLFSLVNIQCQNKFGHKLCTEMNEDDFNDEDCPAERA